MLFDINFNGQIFSVDLPPQLRVEIVEDLQRLHQKYCNDNNQNINFDEYLAIVKSQKHPENTATNADDEIEYDIDMAILTEVVKRKDFVIDGLLDLVRKIK